MRLFTRLFVRVIFLFFFLSKVLQNIGHLNAFIPGACSCTWYILCCCDGCIFLRFCVVIYATRVCWVVPASPLSVLFSPNKGMILN